MKGPNEILHSRKDTKIKARGLLEVHRSYVHTSEISAHVGDNVVACSGSGRCVPAVMAVLDGVEIRINL